MIHKSQCFDSDYKSESALVKSKTPFTTMLREYMYILYVTCNMHYWLVIAIITVVAFCNYVFSRLVLWKTNIEHALKYIFGWICSMCVL